MIQAELKQKSRKYKSFTAKYFGMDFNEQLFGAWYGGKNRSTRIADFKRALFNRDIDWPDFVTESQSNILHKMRVNIPSYVERV